MVCLGGGTIVLIFIVVFHTCRENPFVDVYKCGQEELYQCCKTVSEEANSGWDIVGTLKG